MRTIDRLCLNTALASCCFLLFSSLPCKAASPDSTYKDWYYTPNGVFGRLPISDTRYRSYVDIDRDNSSMVSVRKYSPAGKCIDTYQIRFANGKISLITETNQWGETFDSLWLKPDGANEFIVRERSRGQNPFLPAKTLRFTYKNDLLREILCLRDSTKPGPDQAGVSHYVFERYDDPQRFGLVKSETFYNEIDMPVISRREGCFKLFCEYDKHGNLIARSAYDPKDKPMTDGVGASKTAYKYDKDDNQTETDYFDAKGSPVVTFLGYAQVVRDYKKGLPERETYYEYDNRIARSVADSVAGVQHKYDNDGNETERTFFDIDGGGMNNNKGVYKMTFEYSSSGMLTGQAEFALTATGLTREYEIRRVRFGRDAKGRLISTITLDVFHLPGANANDSSLTAKFSYDACGRLVSTSYWEQDSLRMPGPDGYHECRVKYDEDGRVAEYGYYDETGRLNPGSRGYSRQVVEYNDDGLVAMRAYFDGERPVLMEDKYSFAAHFHTIQYDYDGYGRLRSFDYYDVSGKPINARLQVNDGRMINCQTVELDYNRGQITAQTLHDSADASLPVVLDCATGLCLPATGVGRYLAERRLSALANKTYHGSIHIDSLSFAGQVVFVHRDSVLLFLNERASALSGMACASLYRVVRINKYYQLEGTAIDRYIENDSIAASLTYEDGLLNGPCTYYYMNGHVKEKGEYAKNKRVGHWDYYYENGQKAKGIDFNDDGASLVDCYTKEGQALASNGNGRFEGEVLTGSMSDPLDYDATGSIKNGQPDGEWKLYDRFIKGPAYTEKFSAGKFKHGISYLRAGQREYQSEYDNVALSRFESIHPGETLDHYGQNDQCMVLGQRVTFKSSLTYHLSRFRFSDIQEGVTRVLGTNKYADYSGWVFLDVRFDENGRISGRSAHLYQQNEGFRRDLLNMLDELPNPGPMTINGKKVPGEAFYVVLVEANQVAIPEELLADQRRALSR